MRETPSVDYGYQFATHVIDYWLDKVIRDVLTTGRGMYYISPSDFDIETERREGWGYDHR